MIDPGLRVLRTDISATPIEWIGVEQAVKLYCQEQVAYPLGSTLCRVRGGINARSGLRSEVEVSTILCTQGRQRCVHKHHHDYTPPLNNNTLFRRDGNLCMYCGGRFRDQDLSRDHITPLSRGGQDVWMNVVAACKRCNHFKGDLEPEQAGLELLAVPFTPTHAEYIYLSGRRILADQMEFLQAHFPRNSRLLERLQRACETAA
ncbi:MAG: HNH endonuclease [Proteobacteria bacterium]|nr:MAG: HNH endonuclease [Pseudomonadota bacterium]